MKDLDMLSKSLHKAKINFNVHILYLLNEAHISKRLKTKLFSG